MIPHAQHGGDCREVGRSWRLAYLVAGVWWGEQELFPVDIPGGYICSFMEEGARIVMEGNLKGL